jgi:iron complex outermembrane receptor protein
MGLSKISIGCVCALGVSFVGAHAHADEQQGSRASQLEDVVVTATHATTATKTDTALIETPQAISVVTASQFADRGVLTMQETLRYSAGVTSEAYGTDTRSDQPMARGFFTVQYLDGMLRLSGYSLIPRTETYTLDRIEVLRGPSSMLYGKGNTGGITNVVSKRPQFEPLREGALQFGSYDRRQLQLDMTGSLGNTETWAGRIVSVVRDSDMQTEHVPDDRKLLMPSVTWRPTDQTNVTLLTQFQRDDTASSQQFLPVAATLRAAPGRRVRDETFLGEPDFDKLATRQEAETLLVDHTFTDTLKLSSNWRYQDARTDFNEIYPDAYSNPDNPFIDDDQRIVNRSAYSNESRVKLFTTDNHLQYTRETGPLKHSLLFGLDYQSYRETSRSGSGDANSPIDIYAPVYGTFTAPELDPEVAQRQTQVGVYVQDQIRYADRTSIVLGTRRDQARSTVTDTEKQTDDATTFRAGVIVDVAAGLAPYLSYSESFLPVAGVDFFNQPFKPQKGKQYEAGLKWQPRSQTLLTLAAFQIKETNRQTNDPDNVLNTIQTGEVESKGFELEAAHELARNFNLTAAYSYTKAEVTRSTFAPEVGVQLSDVPKHQASIWGAKTLGLGADYALRLGGGVRYVGETLSTASDSSITTPSYTIADALASVERAQWAVTLNATNLFDKSYYAPCRAFGDCFTGNRRSILGTVRYRF